MPTVEWARPIVKQLVVYQKRIFRWNLATVILLGMFNLIYWFLVGPNGAIIFWSVVVTGIISMALKDYVLKPIELSPPDTYSVNLVRIIDLSSELETSKASDEHMQARDRFHDAVAGLVKHIDDDLSQSRNNLAAWKTIEGLQALRIYLLKFITASTDPSAAEKLGRKQEQLIAYMRDSLVMSADFFHRFYSIESLTGTLQAELASLQGLQEYSLRSKGILKMLRRWYRLPAPLNVTLLILIGVGCVWLIPNYDQFNYSSRIIATVTIIIGVLGLLSQPLRKWLQSVVEGVSSPSA